jgi:hypothetical protein
MVTEADIRRAAREMEARAKKAEDQITKNSVGLRKLTEILQTKGILDHNDIRAIYSLR